MSVIEMKDMEIAALRETVATQRDTIETLSEILNDKHAMLVRAWEDLGVLPRQPKREPTGRTVRLVPLYANLKRPKP